MPTPGPLTVDDRLNISELLVRYGRAMDAKSPDDYAAVFAPDAVRITDNDGRCAGREAIRQSAVRFMGRWAYAHRHIIGQPMLHGNAERCTARSYCQVLVQMPAGPCQIAQVAEYQDICAKIDGQWLIQERTIKVLLDGHLTQRFKADSTS